MSFPYMLPYKYQNYRITEYNARVHGNNSKFILFAADNTNTREMKRDACNVVNVIIQISFYGSLMSHTILKVTV